MRLTTRTAYEWDIEHYDEHGDIIDHDFQDKCPTQPLPEDDSFSIVLVKTIAEGYPNDPQSYLIRDRAWAYVNADDQLAEKFDDGSKVPQRFHKEFNRARKGEQS
jgi:hypothetical protein